MTTIKLGEYSLFGVNYYRRFIVEGKSTTSICASGDGRRWWSASRAGLFVVGVNLLHIGLCDSDVASQVGQSGSQTGECERPLGRTTAAHSLAQWLAATLAAASAASAAQLPSACATRAASVSVRAEMGAPVWSCGCRSERDRAAGGHASAQNPPSGSPACKGQAPAAV